MIDLPKPVWDFNDFARFLPSQGFIHNYTRYAIKCTDAHPLYHIVSAIAVCSTAIAPHMDLYHRDEEHPLHVYVLIIGPSSEGRKTSAIKRATRLAEPVLNSMSQRGARLWWPQLASPEGIIDELAREPNRLMVLSEWTEMHRMSSSKGGYWGHANEFYNLIYDAGAMHKVRAKDQSVQITRPRVSILGASTPSLVEDATSRVDWLGGKLARYIIAPATRSPDREMDSAAEYPLDVADLQRQLAMLCYPVPGSERLTLSSEAWDVMRQWQRDGWWRELRGRAPEHITPAFSRAQEHAFRVAAIYEASATFPYRSTVSADSMMAAVRLLEWCYDATCKTFATVHDNDRNGITKTLGIIASRGREGIARSELLRCVKLPSRQLTEILATLQERNEIRVSQVSTEGRPMMRITYQTPTV